MTSLYKLCRNAAHGCGVSLAWADRQRHEAECDLAVGHCPVLSCSAPVPLRGVVDHLKQVHTWSEVRFVSWLS